MKLTRQSVIAASTLLLGGFIGASALVAAASSSTWVPAPSTPPNCDTSILGCNAPLNVGLVSQTRSGLLGLANLLVTNLTVATSTANPTVQSGYVLTAADGIGTVKWAPASGGSVAGSGYSNMQVFKNSTTWHSPANVSRVKVRVVGGGGGGSNTINYCYDMAPGGNGGYAESIAAVTPDSDYTITVGLGGGVDTNGQASSFSTSASASGGKMGERSTSTTVPNCVKSGGGPGADGVGTAGQLLVSGNAPLVPFGNGGVAGASGKTGVVILEY